MPVTAAAEQAGTAGRPVALFVLGLGRSGTSALTRVLSLCGGRLPAGLLGATAGNPRGCWEPRTAVHLNQAILHRHGSSAYDLAPGLSENGSPDAETTAACLADITAFLTGLPAAPLVVIKEPKITAMAGLWFQAARRAGFDTAAVVAVRHPQEVIASFTERTSRQYYVHVSPELASAWWLKYTLLAERDTRGVPRVFVAYANLLEDWRREVTRISVSLGIALNPRDELSIPGMRRPSTSFSPRNFGIIATAAR